MAEYVSTLQEIQRASRIEKKVLTNSISWRYRINAFFFECFLCEKLLDFIRNM
jgi:hypothetical protein